MPDILPFLEMILSCDKTRISNSLNDFFAQLLTYRSSILLTAASHFTILEMILSCDKTRISNSLNDFCAQLSSIIRVYFYTRCSSAMYIVGQDIDVRPEYVSKANISPNSTGTVLVVVLERIIRVLQRKSQKGQAARNQGVRDPMVSLQHTHS
jgi:hypothetical protein